MYVLKKKINVFKNFKIHFVKLHNPVTKPETKEQKLGRTID